MPIKLVTFDFWSTIYHNEPSLTEKRQAVIRQLLAKTSAAKEKLDAVERADQVAWEQWDDHWREKYSTLSCDEWLSFVLDHLRVDVPEEDRAVCCAELQSLIFAGNTKEIAGVRKTIEFLSERVKLAVISDTGIEPGVCLRKLLRKNRLDYFDYYAFSDEFGRSKPHESVFLSVLDHFSLQAHEAIHIGDSRRADIAGARSVGMHTIRFSGCRDDEDCDYEDADFVMNDYSLLPDIMKSITGST